MKDPTKPLLITLIKKLIKLKGSESADNIIGGMLLIHKDYFSLKQAIQEYLQFEEVGR